MSVLPKKEKRTAALLERAAELKPDDAAAELWHGLIELGYGRDATLAFIKTLYGADVMRSLLAHQLGSDGRPPEIEDPYADPEKVVKPDRATIERLEQKIAQGWLPAIGTDPITWLAVAAHIGLAVGHPENRGPWRIAATRFMAAIMETFRRQDVLDPGIEAEWRALFEEVLGTRDPITAPGPQAPTGAN